VESCFGPYVDSANLDVRLVHGLRRTWTHLMELLGDVGHVESCFGPFEDNISAGAREVYGLRPKYHRLRNHFGCT
jgi:hypothetical protein